MVAGVGVVNGIGVGVEVEVGEIERVEQWKSELKQKCKRSRKSSYDLVVDNKKIRVLNGIISGTKLDHTPIPPPNRKNVGRNLVNSLNRWSPQTCSDGINF